MTGKPARYNDVSLDDFFKVTPLADLPLSAEDPTGLTFRQNFTGWWTLYRNNWIVRDYALLDQIHPKRLNLESWMVATGYNGEPKAVLKRFEDTSFTQV